MPVSNPGRIVKNCKIKKTRKKGETRGRKNAGLDHQFTLYLNKSNFLTLKATANKYGISPSVLINQMLEKNNTKQIGG